jgi:hypothetical protein
MYIYTVLDISENFIMYIYTVLEKAWAHLVQNMYMYQVHYL